MCDDNSIQSPKAISNANAKFGTQKGKILYLTFDTPMHKCYFIIFKLQKQIKVVDAN